MVCQAQADMARQGEEAMDVDRDDAFKNLAKTLNLLLERLENTKTGIWCGSCVLQLFLTSNSVTLCMSVSTGKINCFGLTSTVGLLALKNI